MKCYLKQKKKKNKKKVLKETNFSNESKTYKFKQGFLLPNAGKQCKQTALVCIFFIFMFTVFMTRVMIFYSFTHSTNNFFL